MINVLPYVELNGKWIVDDSVIASVFYKMVSDGTAETVFYEGEILSPEDFIRVLKSPGNLPCLVFVDEVIQGIAWLNELKGNHATAHFCVFKESWGQNSKDMGLAVLKYWFSFENNGKPLLDVILGVTPSEYRFALKFITDLGFKVVGEVPKVLYNVYKGAQSNAVLSYRERL